MTKQQILDRLTAIESRLANIESGPRSVPARNTGAEPSTPGRLPLLISTILSTHDIPPGKHHHFKGSYSDLRSEMEDDARNTGNLLYWVFIDGEDHYLWGLKTHY